MEMNERIPRRRKGRGGEEGCMERTKSSCPIWVEKLKTGKLFILKLLGYLFCIPFDFYVLYILILILFLIQKNKRKSAYL